MVINLEAGFEGYFRSDRWVPLLVSVSNDGPDISGELRVTSNGTFGLTDNAYKTPIELPTGSSKQIFLYVNLESGAQHVKVELANDAGIITDVTRPVRGIMGADLLYAVITESPRGTIDLKNVRSGIGEPFQVTWRLDNIPRSVDGLRALDVMRADRRGQRQPDDGQRRALSIGYRWRPPHRYGRPQLAENPGRAWRIPAAQAANGTITLTSLPSIAAYAGRPADTWLPGGYADHGSAGHLVPGARALVEESGIPLVARRARIGGESSIISPPIRAWSRTNPGRAGQVSGSRCSPQPAWSQAGQRE